MNSINEINDFEKKLHRKIIITKTARYFASSFYSIKSQFSNAAIGFLSAYVIIINLIPILKNNIVSTEFITFFTISVSILILVFSQLESSKEYKLFSSRLLNCGKELRSLENALDTLVLLHQNNVDNGEKSKKLEEMSLRYETILNKYQENHNYSSYHKAMLSCEGDKFNNWQKFLIEIRYLLLPRFEYLLLIILPPLVLVFWLLQV